METTSLPTISSALEQIRAGKLTPLALTQACHRQIERLNPEINAFITVLDDAEAQAEKLAEIPAGHLPLYGIPIAIKDLYETKDIRTTSGTPFFKDYVPGNDAFVIEKLKNAGAVITGKTNTHEIALGVTGVNPHFGTVKNPWKTDHITGGSSSGSAAAVACGMSIAALGTDTGGSIRIPASLCGIVGLKPTFGRISTRGVTPLSWNLDHVGPLTRSVRDAAILLQVLAGYDDLDPASINAPVDDYLKHLGGGVRGWCVAYGVGEYIEETDPEVLALVSEAANVLRRLGAEVKPVDVSFLRAATLANGLMVQADAAAFHRERLEAHPDRFGTDIRQRLEFGRSVSSTDYVLARRKQTETRRQMEDLFADYDVLLMPSTPICAPAIEGNDAIEQARKLTRFTAPFNLAGLPALSVPCGFTKSGLPVGLQVIGAPWEESKVLQAGHAFEQSTDWHTKFPDWKTSAL